MLQTRITFSSRPQIRRWVSINHTGAPCRVVRLPVGWLDHSPRRARPAAPDRLTSRPPLFAPDASGIYTSRNLPKAASAHQVGGREPARHGNAKRVCLSGHRRFKEALRTDIGSYPANQKLGADEEGGKEIIAKRVVRDRFGFAPTCRGAFPCPCDSVSGNCAATSAVSRQVPHG
jgi:hypothetical protein